MTKYEANWESLNSAPVPAWFNEAKLALYIFWGPYSVPAYHPDRTAGYAEWIGGQEYGKEYMREHYGEGFIYEDFADHVERRTVGPRGMGGPLRAVGGEICHPRRQIPRRLLPLPHRV